MKKYICHCGNILTKGIQPDEKPDGTILGEPLWVCDKCGDMFDEEDLKKENIQCLESEEPKYYYCLSCGEYSDYNKEILSHTKKFTKKEFVKMFNEAVAKKENNISKYLCDKFGFKLIYPVEYEIEINRDCNYNTLVPLEKVKENTDYYCTDDYIKWGNSLKPKEKLFTRDCDEDDNTLRKRIKKSR